MNISEVKVPLLSIIVPIYKVEEYLEECINSILLQEFNDFELILVNDGSPDKCGEICDTYAQLDHRVKVIHKANGGLSSARNAGIEIAKGEYLSFIDSDDFISKDYYLKNMQYLNENKVVDMLVSQVCCYDGLENKIVYNKDKYLSFKKEILEYLFSTEYIASSWINIYKRYIFGKIRFPENRIYEDGFILPEIAEIVNKLYISSTGIYYYRNRDNSITNRKMTLLSYKQQLDTYTNIIGYCMKQKIKKKKFIHHFSNYSHILLSAIRDYGFKEFSHYVSLWSSYRFKYTELFQVKSLKSRTELFLLKALGFKIISNLLK